MLVAFITLASSVSSFGGMGGWFLVRTFCGIRVEVVRRGGRESWREPMVRRGDGWGRWDMVWRRARSWARARAGEVVFEGVLWGGGCSWVEKIQHSVSGARVRSR